jgi:hypothetical protein
MFPTVTARQQRDFVPRRFQLSCRNQLLLVDFVSKNTGSGSILAEK